MKRMNSRSLSPSTSVKLSVFQVITVVKRSPAGGSSVCQSSVTTGCQVGCQMSPLVGTSQAGVPMLAPKVNKRSKLLKRTRHTIALPSR